MKMGAGGDSTQSKATFKGYLGAKCSHVQGKNVTTLVKSKTVVEFVRHRHDGLLNQLSGKEFHSSHPMFLDCISSFSSS